MLKLAEPKLIVTVDPLVPLVTAAQKELGESNVDTNQLQIQGPAKMMRRSLSKLILMDQMQNGTSRKSSSYGDHVGQPHKLRCPVLTVHRQRWIRLRSQKVESGLPLSSVPLICIIQVCYSPAVKCCNLAVL